LYIFPYFLFSCFLKLLPSFHFSLHLHSRWHYCSLRTSVSFIVDDYFPSLFFLCLHLFTCSSLKSFSIYFSHMNLN
jgi:hypothetical protein